MALVRMVNHETDDLILMTVCDACGEEGHDAPKPAHDADGNLLPSWDGCEPTALYDAEPGCLYHQGEALPCNRCEENAVTAAAELRYGVQ